MIERNKAEAGPAAAWAREAGRAPDTDALAAVLAAEADPFAEDLVTELAAAPGFRFAATAEAAAVSTAR